MIIFKFKNIFQWLNILNLETDSTYLYKLLPQPDSKLYFYLLQFYTNYLQLRQKCVGMEWVCVLGRFDNFIFTRTLTYNFDYCQSKHFNPCFNDIKKSWDRPNPPIHIFARFRHYFCAKAVGEIEPNFLDNPKTSKETFCLHF